jgi:hypothetical protein
MALPIKMTVKTLMNGIDLATLDKSQVFDIIAEQEGEIAKLSKIENKPIDLEREIAARKAGIQKLVDHLNAKTAAADKAKTATVEA